MKGRTPARTNRLLDEVREQVRDLLERIDRLEQNLGIDFPEPAEHWRARRSTR